MVAWKTLSVQVLEVQDPEAGEKACAELQTRATISKSVGKTCHTFISLQPNRQCVIRVEAHKDFDWGVSNGLLVMTTFDTGDKVADAEDYFVLLSEANSALGATALQQGDNGLYGQIRTVTQHTPWDPNQQTSFSTTLHAVDDSNTHGSVHNFGRICVKVHRCKFDIAGRRSHERPMRYLQCSVWPGKARLDAEGILSRVTYPNQKLPQSAPHLDFRISRVEKMATFELHYRVPEEFQRLKEKSQREDHINPEKGGYRVGKAGTQLTHARRPSARGPKPNLASTHRDAARGQGGEDGEVGFQSEASGTERGREQQRQKQQHSQPNALSPPGGAPASIDDDDEMDFEQSDPQLGGDGSSVEKAREMRFRNQIKECVLTVVEEFENGVSQLVKETKAIIREIHTEKDGAFPSSREEIEALKAWIGEMEEEHKSIEDEHVETNAELQ